jgi:uncharacterized membrane protein HdeD (DUF308 family)
VSDTIFRTNLFHDRLRTAAGKLFWLGMVLLALGIAAVIFPMVSTLVATVFIGWILLISGIVALAGSFSFHGAGPFFGALLLGLLSIAAATFLLMNPLAGAVALTLMLGMIFMIQGAFELFFAFEMRPFPGWPGMLASAIISIIMAVLILAAWPGISMIALGLLLGVNFISSGLGYIVVSRVVRR